MKTACKPSVKPVPEAMVVECSGFEKVRENVLQACEAVQDCRLARCCRLAEVLQNLRSSAGLQVCRVLPAGRVIGTCSG